MLKPIGPMELVVILTMALVIFSRKRIPELTRVLGEGVHDFRESIRGLDGPGPPSGPHGVQVLGRVPKLRRGGGPFHPRDRKPL